MVKKAESEEQQHSAQSPAPQLMHKAMGANKVGGIFRHIVLTAFIVLIALLTGLGAINYYVIQAGAAEQGERLAGVYARQFSGFYDQVFSQASRQIAGVTADKSLADLLVAGNDDAIRQRAALITSSLANRAEIYLVSNQAPPANLSLGFAAQAMLENAQRGDPTSAEIIPLKERPLLLQAASVRDSENRIVGALLVGFDLNDIAADLKRFDAGNGYMTLQQHFEDGGETQAVMSHGDPGAASSPFRALVPTIHPNLTLSFSLRPELATPNTGGLFVLLAAGTVLLVLGAIVVASLLLRYNLRKNISMLIRFAESLVTRSPIPAGIAFSFDLFADAAASLSRTAREQQGIDAQRVAPANPRPANRDVLDMVADPHDIGEQVTAQVPQIADEIFRAYDIRGVVGKTFTEATVKLIGKAIGSEALDNKQAAIHVGRDGRLSGPQLLKALIEGITSTGCNVVDLGMVPTPLVYFAAANSAIKSGVMLTGSHNPPDHNGLKIVINGDTLSDQRIQGLKQRILRGEFHTGSGTVDSLDISGKYKDRVRDDIVLARPMKIVVDCGNGIAGAIAPQLLESLGCSVTSLYCDVDGHFPNHHPDPSRPENLTDLIARVIAEKADIGLAFDGDGDRIGVVTPEGKVIWPDRLMMLYARDLLMRTPGADIIFDVKCTRDLAAVISQHGGRPIMWRTGHSLIKAKLKETGAALAGEMSGHIFFNDRWPGFDDAIYAAARLLEILSLEVGSADEVFAEFPSNISTPELHVTVTEDSKFRIVEALQRNGQFPGGSMSTIDGVRVDYPNAWGLVRASNTTPVLVARFEGKTEQELETVRSTFREQLLRIDPSLHITF